MIRNQTFAVKQPGRVGPAPAGRGGPADRAEQPGQRRRQQGRGTRPTRWRRWSGTEPVSGPGLKVTLDDAQRTAASLPEGFTADDIVVHQQDVQSVVNALWAGGAEAMMLQDQRVISTSAVRCVGNTLILQGRVYSPPYVITAVGDVQGMRQQLDADPRVTIYRQYADLLGLRYDVEDKARLTLPAYAGSLDLVHARAGG